MIPNEYPHGSLVRIEVEFRDDDNALTDPEAVFLHIANPAGTVTDYEFGDDVEVVQDGVGLYHLNLTADRVGTWHYRWTGDDFATEQWFVVRPSVFSA